MALYTYISRDQLPGLDYNYGPDPRQTQLYNALGRNSGNNNGMNFFQKRGRSLENAFGTTGAAIASIGNDLKEQLENSNRQKKFEQNMGDIYRSAGFNNADDYYNAKEAAERDAFGRIGFDIDDYWNKRADADIAGDKDTLSRLDASYNEAKARIGNDENLARFNDIQERLKNQSSRNYDEQKKAQERFADYRKNDYISQKINQDRGKFLGSAINTLSTAFDVMAPGAGVLANSIQGGIEGIADELEDNGFNNFDLGRAGQNALIGATTGAVTGGLNKGISNKLAKNGGNLFKGGNAITKGLNTLGSSTAPGRIASTLATGAGRGAVSGAVGGATGAGLSAAMNGGDVLGSAAQGFQQGLTQGAMTGGIMAGANMAANATPGVGNVMRKLNQAGEDWKNSGSNFNERLTNTLTSGDSAVGEWLQGNRQSGALKRLGMVGLSIKPVNEYTSVDPLGNRRVYSRSDLQKLINEFDNYQPPKVLSGNSFDEASEILGDAGGELLGIYDTMYGGEIGNSPVYNKQEWAKFKDWIDNQRSNVDLSGEQSVNGSMRTNNALDSGNNDYNTGTGIPSQRIWDAGVEALGLSGRDLSIASQNQPQRIIDAGMEALGIKYQGPGGYQYRLNGEDSTSYPWGADINTEADFNRFMNDYGDRLRVDDSGRADLAKEQGGWANGRGKRQGKYWSESPTSRAPLPEYNNMGRDDFDRLYNSDQTFKNVVDEWARNGEGMSPRDAFAYEDTWDDVRNAYRQAIANESNSRPNRLSATMDENSPFYNDMTRGLVDDDAYRRGYLGDNPDQSALRSYANSSKFINSVLDGDLKNMTDDDVVRAFSKLDYPTQQDVLKRGRNWLNEDFMGKLRNASTAQTNGQFEQSVRYLADRYSAPELAEMLRNTTDGAQRNAINAALDTFGDVDSAFAGDDGYNRDRRTGLRYPESEIDDYINRATSPRVLSVSGKDEQYTFASNDNAPRNVKQAALDYAYESDGRIDPSELTDFYNMNANTPDSRLRELAFEVQNETDGRISAEELVDFVRENRTNTPQTLGGWLKQAGKRIAEDIEDRGVGLSTRLVDENGNRVNMAGEAQADNNPQTAVYRALTKDKTITPENAEATLKTSRSEKLRGQAAQELLKQFGTIDKPTAKATNSVKTMQEIANAGFTKPGDIERIADNITGSNGEVNKLVQALVANSKPVNTYDGYDGKSIDEFIDDSIARHALDGINEGKAVKSQIKALFNSLESRRNGSVSMTDMPEDVMDVVRGLEAEAANYEGRSGMNYGTTTPDKLNAAKVLKDVATLLKDRTFETADMERVMTPEVAEGLKSLAPGNEQWAKYVDEKIMTAKTPQDLRSVQAPFVNIKKIIDNGYMNSMTYGGRVGNVANGVPTNRRTIINNAANAIFNSNIANRAKARVLNGAANRIEGTRADQPIRSLPTTTETQTQGEGSTPTTRIYDIIGRQEGLNNGEQARSADYLAQAAQEAEVVPMGNNYATMDQQTPTTANTSVYNAVMGGGNSQGSGTGNGNSYFPTTGDYWTDIIGRAMSAAIDADDVDAFGALYSMYQSQIANLQKQSASANQPQKITSTQQRANAAMNSLNRLSQMKPDLGYDLSGIPVIGGIATLGGNDYEGEAKSLAQQIGYMVSGANIKEEEAFNIGKAYVPQPFDNERTRQIKLQRAYDIIRQYQNGYAVDDGSLV